MGTPLGPGLAPVPQVLRPVLPPPPVVVSQMPPSHAHLSDEPASKKAKTEDNLIPEQQWLITHPVSVCASHMHVTYVMCCVLCAVCYVL